MKSIGTHLFPHLKVGDSFLVTPLLNQKSSNSALANLYRQGFKIQVETFLAVKNGFDTELLQKVTILAIPEKSTWKIQEIYKPGKVPVYIWAKVLKRMNAFAKDEIDHTELYKQILELF